WRSRAQRCRDDQLFQSAPGTGTRCPRCCTGRISDALAASNNDCSRRGIRFYSDGAFNKRRRGGSATTGDSCHRWDHQFDVPYPASPALAVRFGRAAAFQGGNIGNCARFAPSRPCLILNLQVGGPVQAGAPRACLVGVGLLVLTAYAAVDDYTTSYLRIRWAPYCTGCPSLWPGPSKSSTAIPRATTAADKNRRSSSCDDAREYVRRF